LIVAAQTAISTAAPVIVHSLNGKEFTWMLVVGSFPPQAFAF
jgi:hypothetical protein